MGVIYQPKGAALEYGDWACNLFRGCSHGCKYCYAPSVLRLKRDAFLMSEPRANILDNLQKDLGKGVGGDAPVFFCFTSDPYQPREEQDRITRRALDMVTAGNMVTPGRGVIVLTKNGNLAARDFDLISRNPESAFGVSLCWMDDGKREEWEPFAGSVADRIKSLELARSMGIKTWVSVEPVIDASEGLSVVTALCGKVDTIKIGKLNHNRAIEDITDWPDFREKCVSLCKSFGQAYYIKHDLRVAESKATLESG